MDNRISPHFTLEELTASDWALRHGVENTPNEAQVANLKRLALDLLEPIRALAGVPLHVNSGFRSLAVNKGVGGSGSEPGQPLSAHCDGRGADVVPTCGVTVQVLFERIRKSTLPYDKVILECGSWIHIQFRKDGGQPRRLALTASGGPGHWRYQEVPR